jgi:hypothetical protein
LDVRRISSADECRDLDVALAVGYPTAYPFLLRATGCPRVAWLGEPVPPGDETIPEALLRRVPLGRALDAMIAASTVGRRRPPARRLSRLREAAAYGRDRRHNLLIHRIAARAGIRVVVTSAEQAGSLLRRGIRAAVVPFGYHRVMAGDPLDPADAGRDIDVLVLGTATTGVPTRRARITAEVLAGLGPTTRTTVVEDGLWGADRTALLRRSKIVLNVQRLPGNFTGIRSVLAAAAGALVVSEPVRDPVPFIPGTHYVESPAATLAACVDRYVADDHVRISTARAAQEFVVRELPMRASVARLLEAIA